jgi:flagellar basal body rod protein FlgG
LFAPAPRAVATPLDAAAVRLHPGALEGANVDAVSGMVELVDVARGYESYMKALQRLDQITERSINEVGRVG